MTTASTSRLPFAKHYAAIIASCNELTPSEIFDDQITAGSDAALSIAKLAVRSGLAVAVIEQQVFEELPHVREINALEEADIFILLSQEDDPVQH